MNDTEITDYIFIDSEDKHADIAIVFGTWNAVNESVSKAYELYKEGLVKKFVFTGGVKNSETSITEGSGMAEMAISLGIPKSAIIIEDRSTNTLENVVFSVKAIEDRVDLSNIKSIVAVVKNYHSRRALMTLRKHLPSGIFLKSAPYNGKKYDFTRDNWMNSGTGRQKVHEEMLKIVQYLKKGDIAELGNIYNL